MNRRLTAKQDRFIQEYLIDYNAKQAAIRAGHSEKCAKEQGSRLLTYDHVSSALTERKREIMRKMDLKAEDVIADTIRLKDMCMELDEKGKPKDAPTAGMWTNPVDLGDGIVFNVICRTPLQGQYSQVEEDVISADETLPLLPQDSRKDT